MVATCIQEAAAVFRVEVTQLVIDDVPWRLLLILIRTVDRYFLDVAIEDCDVCCLIYI